MLRSFAFAILSSLMLASCQRETQVERANREKILLVGNGDDPKALDPHLVSGVIEANILRSLFEGLVGEDPQNDIGYPPGAATSWDHNEDYTEWTFHLRPEAVWSDGVPVTAHDFLFSYERNLTPALASPYSEMLYFIKNAEAFNKGEIQDFSQVGVSAPDDYTLKISLREPVPYLLGLTRHFTWYPLPEHEVRHFSPDITDHNSKWTAPGNMVSNGAFTLKEWKINDHIEVVKNPRYWDAANVKLNGIRFIPIENFHSETRAYLAGQLHTTYQVPPELVDAVKRDHPNELKQDPYVGTVFIRLNIKRPALDNNKVRLALSLAIDRESLCKSILKGNLPAATFTPAMGNYKPDAVVGYDPERARKLLAEAGFADGKNFPALTMMMRSSGSSAVAETLQAMWLKELGIHIELAPRDFQSMLAAEHNSNFDMSLSGWIGDYLDPTTFLLMWTANNGNNNTDWSDPTFEKLLNEGAHEPDPTKRLDKFKQAERVLMEAQPVIPFALQARNYLVRPEVKGWHPLLLANYSWKDLSLEPAATP